MNGISPPTYSLWTVSVSNCLVSWSVVTIVLGNYVNIAPLQGTIAVRMPQANGLSKAFTLALTMWQWAVELLCLVGYPVCIHRTTQSSLTSNVLPNRLWQRRWSRSVCEQLCGTIPIVTARRSIVSQVINFEINHRTHLYFSEMRHQTTMAGCESESWKECPRE